MIGQTLTVDHLVSKSKPENKLIAYMKQHHLLPENNFWLWAPGFKYKWFTLAAPNFLSLAALILFLSQPVMDKQLTSLTQWSQEHIRDVFESVSDEDSAKAVEQTFSRSINATVNGRQLGYAAIKSLVSSMRKEAPNGLKVQWQQTVDVPCDSTNRVRGVCIC